ncbi:MAG: phage head morphogenesis protein, partial [Cetobacterium sp.]
MSISSISAKASSIDIETINEFIHAIEVSTPLLSVTRGVTSRIIKLRAKHVEDEKKLNAIELRGAGVENFNDFLNKLALAPFYGYVVHEKIYNKDFSIKKLEYIPHSCMKWDKDKEQLMLKGENKEIPITEKKFIISIHDKTLDKPLGKSLFEYGLGTVFEDLKSVNEKVRGLQKAYGDVIPVIGFYQEELDGKTDEEKTEFVRSKAKKYKGMLDNDKIFSAPLQTGIPMKDQIHFISLADLKLEMHKVLMEKYESKIEKFIKGSIYSESTAGSQAKDRVQQDEKEKIEDHIAKFISSELQKLIKDDAMFYGYSPECYYFTFELDSGEGELEKVEQEKVKTKREKMGLFQDLKNLGYKVSAEKIAEAIGLDKKDLLLEDSSNYLLGSEFSKS